MNIKLDDIIEYREKIFVALVVLVFFTFSVSYALNNISVYLFIPFFFLDTKDKIKLKLQVIKKNKTVLLYVLFFLAQLLGIFYSEDSNLAIKRTLVMLPLLFLPAILSVEQLKEKAYNKLLSFLKYAIPLVFIYYLVVHYFIDGRALNTFVHFTIKEKLKISQFYLLFILLLPIFEALRQLQKSQFVVKNGLILILTLAVLLLLGNKTSLVFLGVLCIGFVFNLWNSNKKMVVLSLVVACIAVASAIQVPVIKNKVDVFLKTTDLSMETIITKNSFTHTKNTAEHRVLIAYLAVKEIVHSLPFGVGTGDYQLALNKQYKAINFKAALKGKGYNTHNQYLSEFLKTGVLGGILFIMLILALWKIPKGKMGFYILLFFSLGCLVESYLVRQHGVVILAFMIPFLIRNEKG